MIDQNRRMFIRPLTLALLVSIVLELISFALFSGVGATSSQSLILFIWMVGCGGIGMGAILGVLLDLIIVGRLAGKEAVQGTVLLTVLTMGIVAKLLSINVLPLMGMLTAVNATLFFIVGVTGALAGGWVLGKLLFSKEGNAKLARLGL